MSGEGCNKGDCNGCGSDDKSNTPNQGVQVMDLNDLLSQLGGGAGANGLGAIQPKEIKTELGEEKYDELLKNLGAKELYTKETMSLIELENGDKGVISYPVMEADANGQAFENMDKMYVGVCVPKGADKLVSEIFRYKTRTATTPVQPPIEFKIFGEELAYDLEMTVMAMMQNPLTGQASPTRQKVPSIPQLLYQTMKTDRITSKVDAIEKTAREKVNNSKDFSDEEKKVLLSHMDSKGGMVSLQSYMNGIVDAEVTAEGLGPYQMAITANIEGKLWETDAASIKKQMEGMSEMKSKLETFTSLTPAARIAANQMGNGEIAKWDETVKEASEEAAQKILSKLEEYSKGLDEAYDVQSTDSAIRIKHGPSVYHRIKLISFPNSSEDKVLDTIILSAHPKDSIDTMANTLLQYTAQAVGNDPVAAQQAQLDAQNFLNPYIENISLTANTAEGIADELITKIDGAVKELEKRETVLKDKLAQYGQPVQ